MKVHKIGGDGLLCRVKPTWDTYLTFYNAKVTCKKCLKIMARLKDGI
jgi:hypothetical protein